MASTQHLGPTATPLTPISSRDFFTKAQWDILFALFDGVLPSLVPASAANGKDNDPSTIVVPDAEFKSAVDRVVQLGEPEMTSEAVANFLKYRATQSEEFQEVIIRGLAVNSQRDTLGGVLKLLGTRLGSLLLTGSWTPIDKQPAKTREAILKSWSTSRILTFRLLTKSIVMLAQNADSQTNPWFGKMTGYPDVPKGWKPVQGYDFKFIQPSSTPEPHVITTDVVIVGSGCGAGVCAKNLAEAGHKVLVVDKGYYFPPSQLPMPQGVALSYLFDHEGVYMSTTSSTAIVCGGSWGGGGTVNWSVCLKLQDYVRKEWAADGRLPFFTSSEFDKCSDRVLGFAGAGTTGIRHNQRNQALIDGSRKLGWRVADAPQNTGGKEHYCGHCHLGCGMGEKRGPAAAWLPAAGEAGAQFMEGMKVDKVLFADDGKTAIGIEGMWTSRDTNGGVHTPLSERTQQKVVIKAKRVIISAGSLWSPLVLMSSGISNQHLGHNLHLHPCNFVSAVYNEETRPWEGGIITSYSSEFENLDEKGHGVKLEPTSMVPYATLATRPWLNGLDSKSHMLNYGHMATFISLARDRDSGKVSLDKIMGGPSLEYNTSDYDASHALEGVQALAKICYVTGAKEIRPHLAGVEPFIPTHDGTQTNPKASNQSSDPEFTDPAFAKWLQTIRRVGNKPPTACWTSAHQMGTCRMGATEQDGVVDGKGKVFGKEGLYVADASVFPSASGVNPMATVLTVADWISRGVDEGLKG